MIVVHHLNDSRSQRILWLLEELALDYRIVQHQRDPKTRLAPPSLLAVHRLGKSPVVEMDGGIFIESGAIIDAIIRRHDSERLEPPANNARLAPPAHSARLAPPAHNARLAPPVNNARLAPPAGSAAHDRYQMFLHYAEGSAMLPLMLRLYTSRLGEAAAPLVPRIDSEIANHLGFVDSELHGRDWLLGADFTAADIQMSFVGEIAGAFGLRTRYPAIDAWVQRFQARPAWQAALARGGPYSFA